MTIYHKLVTSRCRTITSPHIDGIDPFSFAVRLLLVLVSRPYFNLHSEVRQRSSFISVDICER